MAKRRARAAGPGSGHEVRRRLALGVLVLASLGLLTHAFRLQVVEHGYWLRKAEVQHADTVRVPAARGTIYDRDGVPLASSREVYIVAVAPPEVKDTALVIGKLREELGLSAASARQVFRGRKRWVPLPGRFEETARAALSGVPGVHFEPTWRRFYPHGELAAEVLGRVNLVGEVGGGLEQELDSILAGRDGKAVKRVDSYGRPIPGAMVRVSEPEPGRDVVLTLDVELQEIATDALRDAIETTGAAGGDLLIVDPETGEILAAVSRTSRGRAATWAGATTPYEPGSTIKPFTVASLLAEGAATLEDSIFAEDGSYRLNGRTITDVHGYGWLTLREAFLHSSNIVMAKAAHRLAPERQYARLRDFGFGAPTGVGYPAEASGRLRRPDDWSRQSQASLAFGYEVSVTPLQLVMGYAAIANGGVLMEPLLVRQVRSRSGAIYRERGPRAVRRALEPDVAAKLRTLLTQVVEEGTGQAAALDEWRVAGKTGTARFAANGRYVSGAYISTFAGFFPAEEPQIVFLVKLDRPQGQYYGGQTAAPVTRATLQAALAARGTPLDRSKGTLAGIETAPAEEPDDNRRVAFASVSQAAEPVVVRPVLVRTASDADAADPPLVPDVRGEALRDAVRALHAAGFRVRVRGSGTVVSTEPSAGERAEPGSLVVVRGRSS